MAYCSHITGKTVLPGILTAALFLSLLIGCSTNNQITRGGTEQDYWIWPGRDLDDYRNVERLYVLQGHYDRHRGRLRFRHGGVPPRELAGFDGDMILTYRLDDLVSVGALLRLYRLHAQEWADHGIRVIGLQIDYDSPSRRLGSYARWLRNIRKRLQETDELSITGLVDWLVSAKAKDLRAISQVTDYTAFMMYHGSSPLKRPDGYLHALARRDLPFRLGLLSQQTGEARYQRLQKIRAYQGQIIFLLPGETN